MNGRVAILMVWPVLLLVWLLAAQPTLPGLPAGDFDVSDAWSPVWKVPIGLTFLAGYLAVMWHQSDWHRGQS